MKHAKKSVCVVGLGYIGLPTAALLANRGYRVFGVDIQPGVVETINQGRIHIVEPDLDSFVHAAVGTGALTAHTEPQRADIFIIAVPTPLTEERSPKIDYVWSAARQIAPLVSDDNLVVLESTSPVGTTNEIARIIGSHTSAHVHVAHCPERVLPGRIMIELSENDRIVGGVTDEATSEVARFYRDFVVGDVLETTARTAEMTKLVENASRDVQIAFANELSMLGDRFGVDVREVIALANHHPRVNILSPGPGVGGHCIAVDPWFLVDSAPDEAVLIRTARERNLAKTEWVVAHVGERIRRFTDREGHPPIVAIMGLAYKANIDDLRESPAVTIATRLAAKAAAAEFRYCEPNLESHSAFALVNPAEAVAGADIVVFLVAHSPFTNLAVNGEVLDYCGIRAGAV